MFLPFSSFSRAHLTGVLHEPHSICRPLFPLKLHRIVISNNNQKHNKAVLWYNQLIK